MSTHVPVLLKETLDFLHIKKGGKYIDATFGGGGHARVIAEAGGEVLALDWDPNAVQNSKFEIRNSKLVNGNFRDIEEIAKSHGFHPIDGVLFDLGISSVQLDEPDRGFSFQSDAPLDMRINRNELGVTAGDLVNGLREDQLYELFKETSDSRMAWAVARTIVRARNLKRVQSSRELADVVGRAYRGRERKINPATTIFLALRMAVNTEIENLEKGLEGAFNVIDAGGRLVVISFHSGEDRVVKDFIRVKSDEKRMVSLTGKPVTPGEDEIAVNPRARSAKMRAAKKI